MTDPAPGAPIDDGPAQGPRRALTAAGILEPITLLVLVVNLATVHVDGVAAVVGPLHGTVYLVAVIASWAGRFSRRARLLVWLPGIGALLAARAAASPPDPATPPTPVSPPAPASSSGVAPLPISPEN